MRVSQVIFDKNHLLPVGPPALQDGSILKRFNYISQGYRRLDGQETFITINVEGQGQVPLTIAAVPTPTPPPTPTPTYTPTPTSTPKLTLYKLVWYNHYEPHMLYEVTGTNLGVDSIRNDGFKQWCKPFFADQYTVVSKTEVAGDEHFKQADQNWWTRPPYNLPALKERWFQIMDNERWYVYTLKEK